MPAERTNTQNYKNKLSEFEQSNRKLFDDISTSKCQDFALCDCPKDREVPVKEQSFLIDQRSKRKMYIGCIDQKETRRMKKSFERKSRERKRGNKIVAQSFENEEIESHQEKNTPN